MNDNEDNIFYVGNIGNVNTQSRSVYLIDGIVPTLTAGMSHGNTVPFIIVEDDENERKYKNNSNRTDG